MDVYHKLLGEAESLSEFLSTSKLKPKIIIANEKLSTNKFSVAEYLYYLSNYKGF